MPVYGEVSVPVFQSSTFSFPTAEAGAARFSGESPGFIYTRMGNPTIEALEDNIRALEGGYGALKRLIRTSLMGTEPMLIKWSQQ